MAALSDFLENSFLNLVFHGTAYAPAGGAYIALFTAPTLDAGGFGNEVVGNGYARVNVPSGGWTTASGATPGAQTIQNINVIAFPTATPAGWGTITHVAIVDGLGGGANYLWHGPLAAVKVVGAGDTFQFLAGQLVVGLS